MKKLLLLAACCTLGMSQAQAQYIKQVLTISLTGYLGQTAKDTSISTSTYKAQTFKMTDKDICRIVAADFGISVKSPQLVRIYPSDGGEAIGTYVMDSGRVVASADDWFAYGAGPKLETGTYTKNLRTGFIAHSCTYYRHDAWLVPYFTVSGMNTVTWKSSYREVDSTLVDYTLFSYSYSATVSGYIPDVEFDEDSAVVTGTIKATSSAAKTIPGLD